MASVHRLLLIIFVHSCETSCRTKRPHELAYNLWFMARVCAWSLGDHEVTKSIVRARYGSKHWIYQPEKEMEKFIRVCGHTLWGASLLNVINFIKLISNLTLMPILFARIALQSPRAYGKQEKRSKNRDKGKRNKKSVWHAPASVQSRHLRPKTISRNSSDHSVVRLILCCFLTAARAEKVNLF